MINQLVQLFFSLLQIKKLDSAYVIRKKKDQFLSSVWRDFYVLDVLESC